MNDPIKKPEPKKIRMPPLLDKDNEYDTLSFYNETLPDSKIRTFWKTYTVENDEDNHQNNSESIQQLESDETN